MWRSLEMGSRKLDMEAALGHIATSRRTSRHGARSISVPHDISWDNFVMLSRYTMGISFSLVIVMHTSRSHLSPWRQSGAGPRGGTACVGDCCTRAAEGIPPEKKCRRTRMVNQPTVEGSRLSTASAVPSMTPFGALIRLEGLPTFHVRATGVTL